MAIRIPWDQYEAALLLDYCIKVECNTISRAEAISVVSQILRNRAILKGYEIDDVFRNENGIGMQMSAIRNCYSGKKQGLTISKLFYEVVALRKDNPEAFFQILQEESKNMGISTWQEFLLWLKENYANKEKDILAALMMVNALGRKNRVLKKPLGDISSLEELESLMKSIADSSFGFQSKKYAMGAHHALELYAEFLRNFLGGNGEESESDELVTVAECNSNNLFSVDFNELRSYAHTKPVSCTYKGVPIKLSGWNAIFHALVQRIYVDYKDVFPVGQSLSSSGRIDTGSSDGMIYPKEIGDGVYLECNVSSTGVVNKLRSLMDVCGVEYSDIEIQYRSNAKNAVSSTPTEKVSKPQWEPLYTDALTQILSAKYKYGFRIGSAIEMMKIRNYADSMNLSLPESDEELEKEINAIGVNIEGKIYVFSAELLSELGTIIDEIFHSGVAVIFLKAFGEKQEEWLEEKHLASETLLKEVIKQSRPNLYLGQNIITAGQRLTEHEAVVSEIHRVAGDEAIVWTSDLSEQLIYIPSDKISWSLSASDEFVWVSEGKYFRMSHFIHSNDDRDAILDFVEAECNSKGYASITDIPMGSIPEENFELSTTALYSAVYIAILKNNYYLNGKIITTDQNGVDISILLNAFCQDRDECTATEVMERAEELTGSINKQHSLISLYDNLVRVDTDRFVSEKQVNFDVEQIDELLSRIIGERFAPIRKVSTFALFPACGLSWNLYLLESYCYRFSRKYRLSVLNYNDKNAGIIVASNLPLTYNEILSEAAAEADIKLTPEAVGEYLFTNGFTAKRKYSSMPEIIERAKNIREEE